MTHQVRPALPSELPSLVAAMDQQFVFGKGRRLSLAQRFPDAYGTDNAGNIFVCEDQGNIVSALVCKCFTLQDEGSSWQGAMVGGVFTEAARRGEGWGSILLTQAADILRQRGLDFAVLWTAQPSFYARLGWIAADRGVLGLGEGSPTMPAVSDCVQLAAHEADTELIDRLRLHGQHVLRSKHTYQQIPLPADSVEVFLWGNAAYALLGRSGDTGILYEMAGDPAGFEALWSQVRGACVSLIVNDVAGSESHRWLSAHAQIGWQDKSLAMWLPLSSRMSMNLAANWYIPYFDRI